MSATTRRAFLLGSGTLALGVVAGCSTETERAGSGRADATTTTTIARGAPGVGGGDIAVRDVRIFNGDRLLDADTLIVEGGLITAVGAGVRVPDGTEVVDGAGGFLLPGLIDAHVHTNAVDQLVDSLRFGVCTVLDMFSVVGTGAQGRDLRSARESLAPTDRADFWSAGIMCTAPGGHGTQFGIDIPVLAPGDDADAFVAARAADGSDFIKIVIEDGSEFGRPLPTLTAEQVDALVAAAHDRGLLAVVHATGWGAAEIALAAGADVLAHVPGGDTPDSALVERIAVAGMGVVATVSVRVGVECTDHAVALANDPRIGDLLTEAQRQGLTAQSPYCTEGELDEAIANVGVLHRAGVPILAGTDFSNFATAAGASLLLEVEMLVRGGLGPLDALRAATSIPADTFGLVDRGRLDVGLRGDLVLLDADPLDDITALRGIAAVWKNGFAVDRSV